MTRFRLFAGPWPITKCPMWLDLTYEHRRDVRRRFPKKAGVVFSTDLVFRATRHYRGERRRTTCAQLTSGQTRTKWVWLLPFPWIRGRVFMEYCIPMYLPCKYSWLSSTKSTMKRLLRTTTIAIGKHTTTSSTVVGWAGIACHFY